MIFVAWILIPGSNHTPTIYVIDPPRSRTRGCSQTHARRSFLVDAAVTRLWGSGTDYPSALFLEKPVVLLGSTLGDRGLLIPLGGACGRVAWSPPSSGVSGREAATGTLCGWESAISGWDHRVRSARLRT